METFSKEDQEAVQQFLDFYTDLVENHIESLPYSLSERAVLDWFGKTIKGEKNIGAFLKEHVRFNHLLDNPKPVSKIGFRDSHVVNIPKEQTRKSLTLTETPLATGEDETPPKTEAGSSHIFEQGQGDGLHNCDLPVSPMKRFKKSNSLDEVIVTETDQCSSVKFLSAEGHVQFKKKSSKKFQRETKWGRPCKLEIAYSPNNLKDSTIHLIIYSNEMKCKRNLLKDFEAAASAD